MKKQISTLIPIVVLAIVVAFLGYRLFLVDQGQRADMIPSVQMDKPAPMIALPPLLEGGAPLSSDLYKGRFALVNFFASWCGPCAVEHPYLMQLSKRSDIVLVGVNYKDPNGREWIMRHGDPYAAIGVDAKGAATIDFGVYGLPETFLIDREGIIRARYAGPLTKKIWAEKFEPILRPATP